MKSKIFIGLSALILLSCGAGETVPELTAEEQDMANKKQDLANQTNFNLGMADYGQYTTYILKGFGTADEIRNLKDGATKKFETIMNDAPDSPYSDSAKIYLDSIKYYNDLHNTEVSNSLNELLKN